MNMNEWQWIPEAPDERRITGAACRVREGSGLLTWNWPPGLTFVYLYGYAPDEAPGAGGEADAYASGGLASGRTYPPREKLKLYTREEYKAKGGYSERLDRYGAYAYRIYPAVKQDGAILAYAQEDEGNTALFSMGRAAIRCRVHYRTGWFGKGRTARMTLSAETAVPKEALCYVKKSGGVPEHPGDGTAYPLLSDLHPGDNPLPEIDIGRDDRVRFFFTDGKTYGERYELVHL